MTANEALDLYLSALTPKARAIKSRDIRQFCGKTSAVLHNWRKGRSPIDIAWRDKITEAIGEDIFKNVTN